MPGGNICVANIGSPLPLCYGFFRATGLQLIDFTVLPTVSDPVGTFPADMQIGMWSLGEGELDGIDALWINNELQFAYDSSGILMGNSTLGVTPADPATTPSLNAFEFHTGCDGPFLAGGGPSPGQTADPLWSYIGNLATKLCYSRQAYYSLGWTPATNDSATCSPLADFRGMRCRMFDASGNQTGYGFTTNPIWHFVDLLLRRAIKPEYALDMYLGPDTLTTAEAGCFNWPSIYAAAQYCDYVLPNGSPRFSGSYVFASGSTLAAMLEQVLLCCRGYWYEYAGQIYVFVDQPRDSTFVATGKMLAPSSFAADNSEVNQSSNRFVATYLELGLPAVAQIASMVRTSTTVDIVTVNPNPCATGDIISVGGAVDSSFDANYSVSSVPGTDDVDCTITGGVAASTTGGWIGYIQSRFSQRTPEINHRQHQMAQGQILPPNTTGTRLKRIKVSYDFASMTYDQAMRLLQYEVYRALGIDWLNPILLLQIYGNTDLLGSPYQPPFGLTLNFWSEAVDANGNALAAQFVGDIITLDETVFFEFAGDYEIIDRYTNPTQQEIEDTTSGNFVMPTSRSGALTGGTDQNSGIMQFVLRSFNRSVGIFTDVSVAPNASFQTVPGQLPYAGGSGTGGLEVLAGSTATASVDFDGNVTITWEAFAVRLATGSLLDYSAGSWTGALPFTGACYIYVDDPSFLGGANVYVSDSGLPTPGTGIFVVTHSITLRPPFSGTRTITVPILLGP